MIMVMVLQNADEDKNCRFDNYDWEIMKERVTVVMVMIMAVIILKVMRIAIIMLIVIISVSLLTLISLSILIVGSLESMQMMFNSTDTHSKTLQLKDDN